jgi:hypothetical protein
METQTSYYKLVSEFRIEQTASELLLHPEQRSLARQAYDPLVDPNQTHQATCFIRDKYVIKNKI